MKNISTCSFCARKSFSTRFQYDFPPKDETKFDLKKQKYKRHFVSCDSCGHWFSVHQIDLTQLYTSEYNDSTYGNKISETFEKIISIPDEKSDNVGRIRRIEDFKKTKLPNVRNINLLDIGSGLGVFPYSVKKIGWNCTAIDPDKRSVEHMKKRIGIKTINGNFLEVENLDKFNIITFNKVLEHVYKPETLLSRAKKHLYKDGFIYIEVPDAEEAAKEGKDREEFFIDHLHVFSKSSLNLMCKNEGFKNIKINRIKEPSNKFTLYAFISL